MNITMNEYSVNIHMNVTEPQATFSKNQENPKLVKCKM